MEKEKQYSSGTSLSDKAVEKTSINVKGVTYFDRQKNLKKLYDQHLPKEQKHLTLERFYVGNLQTFCVIFNGLEIGTIPEEHLKKFQSDDYDFQLTNIHIGTIKDKYGYDIYFAKLFVTFIKVTPPKENRIESEKILYLTRQLEEANNKISDLEKRLEKYSSENTAYHDSKAFGNESYLLIPKPEDIDNTVIGDTVRIILYGLSSAALSVLALMYNWYGLFCIVLILLGLFFFFIYDLTTALHNTNPSMRFKLTKKEIRVVINYRNALYSTKENVLLCLDLRCTPQRKKKEYKRMSIQEMRLISAYYYSTKAIQSKVNELLSIN